MTEQTLNEKLLDEATEWYVLMRTDDISDDRADGFARWISQSAAHQAAYGEIDSFWGDSLAMAAGTARQKPATVTALTDHRTAKSPENPPRRRWSPAMIAASVAFLAVSVIGYNYGGILLMDSRSTEVGELADIILDDGSHLVLNTNSQVHIDLQKDKRVVYLKHGEVYFDVAKDKSRPFYVETAGGLVRVLGTKFNIRQRGGHSDVTVLEGSVGVVDYGVMKNNMAEILLDATLKPNQRFSLGNDGVDNVAFPVNSRAVLSWRDRKLIYNGESFATLVEDINRYYDVEIRIGDPVLNDIEVVAILKVEDRATTLKALEKAFDVTARPVSADLITLYPNK
ncbi:hypothetical protein MNBD_ALPHA01-1962 [hydrothermal vent metagenome]|uniref:Uncharacterized protein n=1 Tax=hydrothermal vent metagenome TaxID=652676 RepID=A0A3B0RYD0_9ZZZZ